MRRLVLGVGLGAALLFPLRAHAGLTITTQKGSEPVGTLYPRERPLQGRRAEGRAATSVIIDATAKKVTMVDATNRTYTEMTEEDRKRMRRRWTPCGPRCRSG